MCKGQQTLSEEVSERTHSRVLKLEKENQSLLRTIEKLQAASTKSSTQANHSRHQERDQAACSTSSCSPLTGLQPSCSHGENHTNVSQRCTVTKQGLNADVEAVRSEIVLTDNPDLHVQEKGQLEDGQSGEHEKELVSELDVLENDHWRSCSADSRGRSPGSKSSSPCRDVTGLPAHSPYSSMHTQRLEAKCRTLDMVNQHLQTSLDNTGRFCRSNTDTFKTNQ